MKLKGWSRLRSWLDRRYQRRLQRRLWYDPAAKSDHEAVFIGGCWRSGTSLLREILGRHSQLACGPESHLFMHPFQPSRLARQWTRDPKEIAAMVEECPTLVAFSERFFTEMLAREGKRRWIDKTPQNSRVATWLLAAFPRGRFLHVIRDGRDVVCSLRGYPQQDFVNGRLVPAPPINRSIESCAKAWVRETSAGLESREHPHHMEVRYEELVNQPEPLVRRICKFIEEDFEPDTLEPVGDERSAASTDPVVAARFINNPGAAGLVHAKSVGRWTRELSPAEREVVRDVAGDLLISLGYAADGGWADSGS